MSKLQRWPERNPALPIATKWVDISSDGSVYMETGIRPGWDRGGRVWLSGGQWIPIGRCKNRAACHSSLWRVHWRKGVPWLELIEEHQ